LAPGAAAPEPVLAFTEYSRAWPMENEVLVLHGSPASLSLLDVEAEVVWSLALPSDWQVGSGYTTELAWADDALLLAHALTDGVGVQEIVRATGVVRWSRTLDAMPLNAPIAAAWLGGGWAVTHQDEATRTSRTVAIEAHDGSTRWQREDVLAAEILGPTSSGQFAVLDRTRPAADLEVRSSLDGEPVAATTVSSRLRRLPAN